MGGQYQSSPMERTAPTGLLVELLDALDVAKFDPSQPRDGDGKWTEAGGGRDVEAHGDAAWREKDEQLKAQETERARLRDQLRTEEKVANRDPSYVARAAATREKLAAVEAQIQTAEADFQNAIAQQRAGGWGVPAYAARREKNPYAAASDATHLRREVESNLSMARVASESAGEATRAGRTEIARHMEGESAKWQRLANQAQARLRSLEKRNMFESENEFIGKLDEDQRLVWAWAYVYEDEGKQIVDHSGDIIDKAALADLEKAAYDYVLDSREADEMHVKVTDVAKLVESFFLTPEKAELFGIVTKKYGWIVGYKVQDDAVWAKIKDGTYTGMSIRGRGDREPLEVAA